MKIYSCDVCGEMIYFENSLCLNCSAELGYLPFLDNMSSLKKEEGALYTALAPQANSAIYKKCFNYTQENVCNWMVPVDDNNHFCASCRLNEVIPDLTVPENREYWHRLEIAKRRLVYSLLRLGLPLKNKKEDPQKGLTFEFLADLKRLDLHEGPKVMIGHEHGKITINIAEANDAVREKMRLDMNERYRTLLGHFRHEIGHYYWFLLVESNPGLLEKFRTIFGNEKDDYNSALTRYYQNGKPYNWHQQFVSAYASSHPWEDWAESWAHYLHMFDTIETASEWGLSIKFKKANKVHSISLAPHFKSFEEMQDHWIHLTCTLNSLNRSMGMKDVYPFVLTPKVIEKLRFIHEVITIKEKQAVS